MLFFYVFCIDESFMLVLKNNQESSDKYLGRLALNDVIDEMVQPNEETKTVLGHAIEVAVKIDSDNPYHLVYHYKRAMDKTLFIDIAIVWNIFAIKYIQSLTCVWSHMWVVSP